VTSECGTTRRMACSGKVRREGLSGEAEISSAGLGVGRGDRPRSPASTKDDRSLGLRKRSRAGRGRSEANAPRQRPRRPHHLYCDRRAGWPPPRCLHRGQGARDRRRGRDARDRRADPVTVHGGLPLHACAPSRPRSRMPDKGRIAPVSRSCASTDSMPPRGQPPTPTAGSSFSFIQDENNL